MMYRKVKKVLVIIALALVPMLASAQAEKMPQRNEIVVVEDEEGGSSRLEVFEMVKDGQRAYILSVGHLGVGNKVIQFNVDPVFELFIPLGATLDEAVATMTALQGLFKQPKGTQMEVEGCLEWAFPGEKRETVTVTYTRPLLTRMLDFTVQRDGYVRSTTVTRSQMRSLVSGVKLHRKLHPNK